MRSPTIRAFPRTDDTFHRSVARLMDGQTSVDPSALERALRLVYPRARVTVQDPLASLGEERVWYVFRDGGSASGTDDDVDPSREDRVEAAG